MKLIHCKDCGDIVLIYPKNIVRSCLCRKVAGKYLSNCVTAIVTENAIVLGIDNNGFNLAIKFTSIIRKSKKELIYSLRDGYRIFPVRLSKFLYSKML
jgi:hypothetical protein